MFSKRMPLAAAVAAVLVSAGCASSSGAQPVGAPSASGSSTAAPSGTPSPSGIGKVAPPLPITAAQNGATVHASAGQLIVLDLDSGYWQNLTSSAPSILVQQGAPMRLVRKQTCVAGGGCGIFETDFQALYPGTAVITASRVSCGEAMACAPDKRHFAVTVVVSR